MDSAKNILVIDDEPGVCAYLKDLLGYFGYGVSMAQSCTDAIDDLKSRSYAAVLLDAQMGHESGEVVLRWLRSAGRPEAVVMMSSMTGHETRADFMVKGAADLLGKPVQPTQLHQVLKKALTQPATGVGPQMQPYLNRLVKAY